MFSRVNICGLSGSSYVCVCAVVVAKKENAEPVTLTCDTKTDGPVRWMFEDEEIDFDDVLMVGQNLKVSNVDTPMLGEYSCFRGGQKLSSVHLLMEAEEEEKLGEICFFLLIMLLFVARQINSSSRRHQV